MHCLCLLKFWIKVKSTRGKTLDISTALTFPRAWRNELGKDDGDADDGGEEVEDGYDGDNATLWGWCWEKGEEGWCKYGGWMSYEFEILKENDEDADEDNACSRFPWQYDTVYLEGTHWQAGPEIFEFRSLGPSGLWLLGPHECMMFKVTEQEDDWRTQRFYLAIS